MKRLLPLLLLSVSLFGADNAANRDYWAPLSEKDEEHITYIISTLANESYFKLLFRKGKLETAGDKTAHVHPLKFLRYVMADPKLRQDIKKISGPPWSRFTKRFGKSLETCSKKKNLTDEHLADFAEISGITPDYLQTLVASGDWTRLVERLGEEN